MNATGREPGKAFALKHGDMTVPFHTAESDRTDPETGDWYSVAEIVSFGTSIYLKGDRNVPDLFLVAIRKRVNGGELLSRRSWFSAGTTTALSTPKSR